MQRGSLKIVKNRHGVKVWRAQWRENGRGRTRILGRFSSLSRGEARSQLDQIVAPLNRRQTLGPTSDVSLRRYVEDEYLVAKTPDWKASTRATTEQIIETHILSQIGFRTLASLTRRDLQGLLQAKANDGLSSSVVGHIRWQLVAIFEMALSDRITDVNPAQALVTPKCQGQTDKRTISIEDIGRAQMVLEPRERLVFRLAVCEGMRPGEILGLQLGDLQEDGIHIERRIYRGDVDTPKSRRSRRLIPPTGGTRALLDKYVEMLSDRRPTAWLFPSETGSTPLSYSNLYRRRIQPKLKQVKLGSTNFQVLRRTWVSEFGEVEPDAKLRSSLAGHSVDVHENEYRQASSAALKRAMRKLDRRLQ